MRKLFFILVILSIPAAASAQRLRTLEVTPFMGYTWGGTVFENASDLFGSDVHVADNGSYGIAVNIPFALNAQFELMASRQPSHFRTSGDLFGPNDRLSDVNITYYQAGVLFQTESARDLYPFLVVSLGNTNISPQIAGVSSANRFSGSIGAGVKLFVTQNVGVRFEGRGYWTNTQRDGRDRCWECRFEVDRNFYQGDVKVGIVFAF